MAKEFVLVRLIQIQGADLNLFEFDYDNTWAAFLMNAEGKIYGRYGGRDSASADGRMSLKGLRYAMEKALAVHKSDPTAKPAKELPKQPLLAQNYPAAKFKKGCIHCHNVYEFQRDQLKKTGKWDRDWRWLYPLPENVGITLDVTKGDVVKKIKEDSPAAKAGIKPGDVMLRVNAIPVGSFADAQYGLHLAPPKGQIPVAWKHGDEEKKADLEVAAGWRKTNITWRPSMLDLLPALSLYGDDLTPAEKMMLQLAPGHLAFRQDKIVGFAAKKAGVKADDIIVGVDGLELEMKMTQLLGYVRQNYLIGDTITLNIIRDGQRIDLPMKLTW